MTLAAFQQEFMAHVLQDVRTLPASWDARTGEGLAIYRNAYRARLVDALRETFPRTARWVGETAFAQAAAHHLIVNPPAGWTLDLVGEGFVAVLEELFVQDAEVAELAWLEWAMHLAFVARDAVPLDAAGFAGATRDFGEDAWGQLRLVFVPALHVRPVTSDCVALWCALEEPGDLPAQAPELERPGGCRVWREDMRPVCALVAVGEAEALAAMQGGASFDDVCAELALHLPPDEAIAEAGAMLGRWIAQGLVSAVARASLASGQGREIEACSDIREPCN